MTSNPFEAASARDEAPDQAGPGAEPAGPASGDGGYAPGEEIPLRGYATLAGVYAGGVALFALAVRASGRPLPARIPLRDLLLLGAATYKASRLVTKDKITSFVRAPFTRRKEVITASEVMDEPRGHGLRLATGELLACPFCLSAWVAGSLVCGYVVAPRATRLAAGGLGAIVISDWMQYAWSFTQEHAEG